jgi:hypothetical protein
VRGGLTKVHVSEDRLDPFGQGFVGASLSPTPRFDEQDPAVPLAPAVGDAMGA